MKKLSIIYCALALFAFLPSYSKAEVIVSANFASFTDGPLVGQNGWQQFGASSTNPINVTSGVVSWAGGSTVDNQDAILTFANAIPAPTVGQTILNFDLLLRVNSAGTNPSFFAALSTLNTASTTSNFSNARLAARSEGAGFVFGARVTGQGGYPYAFGTNVLNFGQDYALRAEIFMNPGTQNETINLYVGSDFNNLVLQSTAVFTSGTGTDPTSYGGVVLSQFGSGTVNEGGVSISSLSVTAVPEPASMTLLLGSAIAAGYIKRRRKTSSASKA